MSPIAQPLDVLQVDCVDAVRRVIQPGVGGRHVVAHAVGEIVGEGARLRTHLRLLIIVQCQRLHAGDTHQADGENQRGDQHLDEGYAGLAPA